MRSSPLEIGHEHAQADVRGELISCLSSLITVVAGREFKLARPMLTPKHDARRHVVDRCRPLRAPAIDAERICAQDSCVALC